MTLSWRNKDRVRLGFFDEDPLSMETHLEWFKARDGRDDDHVFLILETSRGDRPIGQISIYCVDWISCSAQLGRIMIGEDDALGKGYAAEAIELACDFARTLGLSSLWLEVKARNKRAQRLYALSGFGPSGCGRDGSVRMTRSLASGRRWWNHWDEPGMAESIDSYWRSSAAESDHRIRLLDLVRTFASGKNILDVGCGTGEMFSLLVPAVVPADLYTGVDVSQAMLGIARGRHPAGRFAWADAHELPFPSRSHDIVVCFEVLCHLPDIAGPIAELCRVSSRLVVFTLWETDLLESEAEIRENGFLYRVLSRRDAAVKIGWGSLGWKISRRENLSSSCVGYTLERL